MTTLTLVRCSDPKPKNPDQALAELYCSSCHVYTPPALLDKSSCSRVLPVMKEKMAYAGQVLSKSDWNAIYSYYYNSAPIVLPVDQIDETRVEKGKAQRIFSISKDSLTSDISMLESHGAEKVLIGNSKGRLDIYENGRVYKSEFDVGLPVSFTSGSRMGDYVLSMGVMAPTHDANGVIYEIAENKVTEIISNLYRPIHITSFDFEGDQIDELIVSSFGSTNDSLVTGDLSLFKYANTEWTRQVLSESTGAIKTVVKDMDDDGLQDIVALFGQGDERIEVYYNRGGNIIL